MFQRSLAVVILPVLLLAGCSQSESISNGTTAPESSGPDAAGKKYLLEQEPSAAKSVTELRKAAKNGDEVVVVGRIGDKGGKPFVEGRAAFVIADAEFAYCTKCEDPYCEVEDAEFSGGRASVKFVDESGQTIGTDARQMLGVKDLDVVVVKGKVKQEGESFIVLATALHRREAKK